MFVILFFSFFVNIGCDIFEIVSVTYISLQVAIPESSFYLAI